MLRRQLEPHVRVRLAYVSRSVGAFGYTSRGPEGSATRRSADCCRLGHQSCDYAFLGTRTEETPTMKRIGLITLALLACQTKQPRTET